VGCKVTPLWWGELHDHDRQEPFNVEVEGNSMNVQSMQLDSARVGDYENGYHWFSTPSRMHKMLAQYELYRQTIGLPGHVLEFGVYKAVSLIRLASYRQLLEVDHSRKIVGFDAFGGFPVDGL